MTRRIQLSMLAGLLLGSVACSSSKSTEQPVVDAGVEARRKQRRLSSTWFCSSRRTNILTSFPSAPSSTITPPRLRRERARWWVASRGVRRCCNASETLPRRQANRR